MPPRAAFILLAAACCAAAQTPAHQHAGEAAIPLQPLAQQVRRLEDAMNYLGQPFPAADHSAINAAIANADEAAAVAELEKILDRYALAIVDINAESRVKVEPGPAKPELVEGGTRLFLVKVINRANVTAPLRVTSPNSGNVYIQSTGNPEPKLQLTPQDAADRWAEISIYDKPPMDRRLSGLALDYRILQIYSRDSGQRSAQISFNVGQGSQDIGFRNDILVLFNALPARAIKLRVRDEKGQPAMASFVIRDRLNRLYPNPSKRLAPDFFFQPQIYRADGESISLPPGYYNITYTGGPEYRAHTKEFAVDGNGPAELSFQLERWIDPAKYGWYSGDHHVHAAGCSHYQNPTEGVLPRDMIRQISGERLNIGSVLTWGPDYYYQKQFFSGHDDPLSKPDELMHYDLEVRISVQPRRPHRAARPAGAGLSRRHTDFRLAHLGSADLPLGQVPGRRRRIRALRLGAGSHERRSAQLRNAGLRRDRRKRVHRGCHRARLGGFHFVGGHALCVGAEYLVPHAERWIPDAHRRRDGFPVHLRSACGDRTHLYQAGEPELRELAAGLEGGAELCLRWEEPPDGFQAE
jgi:hypothetical protein